jgi:hypothetical protein
MVRRRVEMRIHILDGVDVVLSLVTEIVEQTQARDVLAGRHGEGHLDVATQLLAQRGGDGRSKRDVEVLARVLVGRG